LRTSLFGGMNYPCLKANEKAHSEESLIKSRHLYQAGT
jgi:hypothetical protein